MKIVSENLVVKVSKLSKDGSTESFVSQEIIDQIDELLSVLFGDGIVAETTSAGVECE